MPNASCLVVDCENRVEFSRYESNTQPYAINVTDPISALELVSKRYQSDTYSNPISSSSDSSLDYLSFKIEKNYSTKPKDKMIKGKLKQ